MSESLFQISCPSCESVFAVTDPELVGQIVACPKCGGMILVEAAQTAANGRVEEETQDKEDAQNERNAQNALKNSGGEEARIAKETQDEDGESETETTANEAAASGKEGSRVGKLVGGGVALLLVVGAAAFFTTRDGRESVAPDGETGVETKIGQIGQNEGFATSENDAKDDVGGDAPLAVEERTGGDKSETTELAASISGSASEDAEIEGNGGAESVGENGQNEEEGENGENMSGVANFETVESSDASSEDESSNVAARREERQNGEAGENREGGEIEQNGETSENGATKTNDNENSPEIDDLRGGLEELEGLGEEEVLGDLGEEDALENGEEEGKSESRLTGSNASTGFNEADFERANQSDDSESVDEPAEVDWSGVASTTNPTLQGALPTLRRERKEIDVDARLALPIKSIEFPSSPVAALRVLSEFAGVSIVPDLETLVLTRPGMNATLDLTLHDVTVGEALENVAELLKWEVCREKERILIRPAGGATDAPVEERFDVADLTSPVGNENAPTNLEKFELPNNLTPETLAALIRSTVAPETWSENGGRATLRVDGSTLIVGQNAQNREKTRILLEGLRAVRALEPQTDATPERIIPEKLGWEKLTKKTTFAPLTPPALQNVVEIIENAQKLQVFWDDAALNEAGVGRDATTAARVEGGTVDALLSEALEPLNANYLILGENLIFITDGATAENYRTVEIFSIIDAKGKKPTLDEARTLIAEMKQAVASAGWKETIAENSEIEEKAKNAEERESVADEEKSLKNDEDETAFLGEEDETGEFSEIRQDAQSGEGGEFRGNALSDAVVWLDVESACLIIRQSQPNQRALRRWLNARLANSTSERENAGRNDNEK